MFHFTPNSERPWNVPKRADHPAFDGLLTWIQKRLKTHQSCSDFHAIRLLSQAKPENDLTYLCQCLLFKNAAQGLSGTWSTLSSLRFDWDTDEIFEELLPKLQSCAASQSFYDLCGRVNPKGEWRKECQKSFRQIDREWTKREDQYGPKSTGKYFLRKSSDHALYILIFHPDLYESLYQNHSGTQPQPYCNGYESIWA